MSKKRLLDSSDYPYVLQFLVYNIYSKYFEQYYKLSCLLFTITLVGGVVMGALCRVACGFCGVGELCMNLSIHMKSKKYKLFIKDLS